MSTATNITLHHTHNYTYTVKLIVGGQHVSYFYSESHYIKPQSPLKKKTESFLAAGMRPGVTLASPQPFPLLICMYVNRMVPEQQTCSHT